MVSLIQRNWLAERSINEVQGARRHAARYTPAQIGADH